MKKQFLFWSAALLLAPCARGQSIGPSVINAAGGSAAIAGNTYEYSIGEMTLVATLSSPGLVVTQGVLQPQNITTGIGNDATLAGMLSVFPNPATSAVYIRHTLAGNGTLLYSLQDVAGRELLRREVPATAVTATEELSLAAYAAGTYLLSIQAGGKSVSYKIQKN